VKKHLKRKSTESRGEVQLDERKEKGHLGLIFAIGTGRGISRLQRRKAEGLTHDSFGLHDFGNDVGKSPESMEDLLQ